MLLRLLPDQVARYWEEVFRDQMAATLPHIQGQVSEVEKMNNILESFLLGQLVMWLSYEKGEEGMIKISGFLVTQLIVDGPSRTKSCLIYSIYSPDGFGDQQWLEGFKALSEYARSRGCTRITAYTQSPLIVRRAEQFGSDLYTFISQPIVA
jgi:hypothetical protein